MKDIAAELNIPQYELDKTLRSSFYVRIHKGYTATVRNLASFIDYLQCNSNDIDMKMFGEIVKEARVDLETPRQGTKGLEFDKPEDSNFYAYMMEIIGYFRQMPTYNSNPHTFIEAKTDSHTVSIKTPSGKTITIAICGDYCADIQVQKSGLPTIKNGGSEIPQFNILGLGCGDTPVKQTTVTCLSVLLDSDEEKLLGEVKLPKE
jgi:hypothetical protein